MASNDGNDAPPASPRVPRIGVFGGSFNPIHLGHVLLSITTQQTKPVDKVVLVPVFKHHVKTDLLPFADRVAMCKLAVAPFAAAGGVEVSTIEEDVGESNAAMLRALRGRYPDGKAELFWICGDDVFSWIEKEKGLETMAEVDGLIVQRRLHKGASGDPDKFYKEPLDEVKIRAIGARLALDIDFIYGELPHFSSTLVRRAPGSWRSFLPLSVARYLDARPNLLTKLHANLDADAKEEEGSAPERPTAKRQKVVSTSNEEVDAECSSGESLAAECVMRGLEAVHSLQYERGQTGLALSIGTEKLLDSLLEAQSNTDAIVREIVQAHGNEDNLLGFDEALALAAELRQIPAWLGRDRSVVEKRADKLRSLAGADGWAARWALVEKFNYRVDVIMGAVIRSLREILEYGSNEGSGKVAAPQQMKDAPDLLLRWSEGKEALGRLRAFVSAAGPEAPAIVRGSMQMRQNLNQFIETKERRIARLLSRAQTEVASPEKAQLAAPDALHRMLEKVVSWEWSLMGCFAASTPLSLVHKLLSSDNKSTTTGKSQDDNAVEFDVELFFVTTSTAIDLMLNEAKAIAAFGCARA